MRCQHEALLYSLPVGVVRADTGRCGPEGKLFAPKDPMKEIFG